MAALPRGVGYCLCAIGAAIFSSLALAQGKEVKIGVIYDYTGPFAAGGSQAAGIGTKIAIDMINERGGVEGYKIKAIYADAQSKAEVAINEATRLLDQEKVHLIMGVYSSAHCVPMAQKVDAAKKFMWANVCTASTCSRARTCATCSARRRTPTSSARLRARFINENAKAKLNKDPKEVKVAIIYEDGPYGAGVAAGNEEVCKSYGMQIVLKEGYSATAPDLSSLVTKLRRARADVILHTGYNPDITLFWRQAREQGLKWAALIGHGAGYSQYDKLRRGSRQGRRGTFCSVDPVAGQLLDPKSLAPGLGELIAGDGQALQGGEQSRAGAAARLDGVQPDVDFSHRRAAARDQEIRRRRSRGAAQGGARHRHPRRRHHPGLWREVLSRRARDGRPERALLPVIMQYIDDAGPKVVLAARKLRTAEPGAARGRRATAYSNQ